MTPKETRRASRARPVGGFSRSDDEGTLGGTSGPWGVVGSLIPGGCARITAPLALIESRDVRDILRVFVAYKWLRRPQGDPSGVCTGQRNPHDSGNSFLTAVVFMVVKNCPLIIFTVRGDLSEDR